MLFEAIL